jgi:hypothetical protein
VVFAVSKVYKSYLVFNVSRKRFVLLEYPLYVAVVFFCKLELYLCVARGISSFLEISKKGSNANRSSKWLLVGQRRRQRLVS